MSNAELARYGVAIVLTGVLVWAAISDVIARRIPNISVLSVVALYAVWVALGRGEGVVGALVVATGLLVVGFALFAFKIWGGGDAKLLAAVALFAGVSHFTTLIFVTAMVGGLMAVVSLVTRPQRAMVMLHMRGQGDFGRGIPYGVAIALGGAVVVWNELLLGGEKIFGAF